MKTVDQFNFSFNPSINKQQIYELATCRFIREARDVLWLGPPGVGKSFSVQALGYQAIKCGFLVYYRSVFDVVRDFMQDEAFGGQDRVLAKDLMPDLLVIDDMGMKQLPNKSGEFLFEKKAPRFNLLDLNEALDKLEAEDGPVAAIAQLSPCELCVMKASDVDRSGDVWYCKGSFALMQPARWQAVASFVMVVPGELSSL